MEKQKKVKMQRSMLKVETPDVEIKSGTKSVKSFGLKKGSKEGEKKKTAR